MPQKNAKILEIEKSIIPKYTMDLMYMDIVVIGRSNAMEKLRVYIYNILQIYRQV